MPWWSFRKIEVWRRRRCPQVRARSPDRDLWPVVGIGHSLRGTLCRHKRELRARKTPHLDLNWDTIVLSLGPTSIPAVSSLFARFCIANLAEPDSAAQRFAYSVVVNVSGRAQPDLRAISSVKRVNLACEPDHQLNCVRPAIRQALRHEPSVEALWRSCGDPNSGPRSSYMQQFEKAGLWYLPARLCW